MTNTKIILYDCLDIYKILNELGNTIKFDTIYISNEEELNLYIKNLKNYLIIHKHAKFKNKNQIFLDNLPITLDKLIEKINLFILKNIFVEKSNKKIGIYSLNINSREISYETSDEYVSRK